MQYGAFTNSFLMKLNIPGDYEVLILIMALTSRQLRNNLGQRIKLPSISLPNECQNCVLPSVSFEVPFYSPHRGRASAHDGIKTGRALTYIHGLKSRIEKWRTWDSGLDWTNSMADTLFFTGQIQYGEGFLKLCSNYLMPLKKKKHKRMNLISCAELQWRHP